MNKILPIILAVVLSGCAATRIDNVMKNKPFNFPDLKENVTVNIGDVVAERGVRKFGEGITFEVDTFDETNLIMDLGDLIGYPVIKPTEKKAFLISMRDNRKCYGPVNMIFKSYAYGIISVIHTRVDTQICVNSNNTLDVYRGDDNTQNLGTYKGRFEIVPEMFEENGKNMIQRFIYDGLDGNYVKFLYREFTDSNIKSSFEQDVKYNLDDTNIISFKELKIQIHNANDSSISYTLLRNFNLLNE
jgi:hypothetical protein